MLLEAYGSTRHLQGLPESRVAKYAILLRPEEILNNWFLANSSHVVDLAFFLGGKPREISNFVTGALTWHPTASIFAGAGVSETGALFSYQANWDAPGRWGVEVLTTRYRFYFRPMEKLQVQKKGSVTVESYEIDDSLDQKFKPGLWRQVDCFLKGNNSNLCSIEEQASHLETYRKIANYRF